MKRSLTLTSLASCLALGIAGPAFAANIAGNGGFEDAGDNGATDSAFWNEFGNDAPSGTVSERDNANPASGSWAHHLNAFGSATTGGHTAGINQNTFNVNGTSLTPGDTLNLAFDADVTFNGIGDVGFYRLDILNSAGLSIATTGLQQLAPTTGYQGFVTPDLLVPAFAGGDNDAYYAFAEITANAGATAQGSNPEVYVDNVAINTGGVVPEPASLALLGLGGLALVGRRRRA